jgi:hypothetical protein
MAHRMSHQLAAYSKPRVRIEKFRCGLTLLLAIALTLVPPQLAIGQINQDQQREQQAREQQQREQQAREQQQRDQQERDRQAREQQQRDQQQREEQARAQQQREEQRDQQQREQQVREQQQRDQQQREEQARAQQQREEQARAQQQREQADRERERQQQSGAATKASSPGPSANSASTSSPASVTNAGSGHKPSVPQPKPAPTPPDQAAKNCKDKDQPCPVCPAGQSPGKNNSCHLAAAAKAASAASAQRTAPAAALVCPAGQVWNGAQCIAAGAQQCLPGQSIASPSCQTACAMATGGAQNYIQLLRMARQDKDDACLKNQTGQECQIAESTYGMRLLEYRNFLGSVPAGCTLPDPISI